MNGKYLLDTNVVIAMFAGRDRLRERLAGAIFYAPVIALGELYYGARKSAWSAKNTARIDQFAARNRVLVCDLATAQHFGQVKNALRAKGRPIPENDIWVAALALQHDLTLVTRDSHFELVDGLRFEKW